ncbi:MAG: hypothetical protein R3E66_11915 [bacterium]
MTTLKKKKKHKNSDGGEPQVTLDDRSKRFLYALAAIGLLLVIVLAALIQPVIRSESSSAVRYR